MHADLLSRPVNFAVVQLPERSYPGVVVQGDTLHSLQKQVELMGRLLETKELEGLADEIEDLNTRLSEALAHYEYICSERGISLPY
jgi:hypothetical protein